MQLAEITQTVAKHPVRNLQIDERCNKCNLSGFKISGEVFLNQWIPTKWNLSGDNISAVKEWKLNGTISN